MNTDVRRIVPLALALSALALPAAASAAATSGPCRDDGTGPRCHYWYGTVTAVNDGDTIHVDLDGDGTHQDFSVRLIGVQAMEQHVYSKDPAKRRGECHALEATAYLESLLRKAHWRVRLSAQHPSSRNRNRLRRSVATKVGGRWRDVGRRELAGGWTISLDEKIENQWNRVYDTLQQQAAAGGIRMFQTTTCGVGPAQDVPLRTWVLWDPPGPDTGKLNETGMVIYNPSGTAVDLSKWWVRNSDLRRLTFPAGTTLPGGGTITVHTGHGTDTGSDFYFGSDTTIWPNPYQGDLDDGGYLFDPQGDLRAWSLYPCLYACGDPLQGRVRLEPHPQKPESVAIRNVSDAPIDLYGYALRIPGSMFPLPPHTVVKPGAAYVFEDFRHSSYVLPDPGGMVQLKTYTDITVDCAAWGSGRC